MSSKLTGRKGIAELASQLERVPLRKIEYKGTTFEELDTEAVTGEVCKPRVVLIDELAHTNIPGSKYRKRYEDVLDLVATKMEVLSTVNVQHLESIAPTVGAITGIKIRETVPDWVLEHASEIVMVDLTPEALQNRMKRGEVYHTEKVDQALKNFFRRGNPLNASRTCLAPGGGAGGPQLSERTWIRRISTIHGRSGSASRCASARIPARNI